MNFKKLISPEPLPFDFQDWKREPFPRRIRMLCEAWAVQGYGAPVAVYSFYILKIALYIGGWLYFCSFSSGLGGVSTIGEWWMRPEALAKGVAWSMLFEVVGLGCGSGPLTARYFPPVAAVFHFLRPGTIKLPIFPGRPLIGGDQRTIADALLYAAFLVLLVRLLIAPGISPGLIIPILVVLPVLGILDKTIFLASRGEHYFIALCCFLFPLDAIAGAKVVWVAIWFWAATSKLNDHFPSVIGVMVSNSAVLRIPWLRKKLYRNYPNDLRPGKLAATLAHLGTIVEYTFPLLLIFGQGGPVTIAGLAIMFCFHLYITTSVPMAVPLEWNFIMVYGAFLLFGVHADVWIFSMHSPGLIAALVVAVGLVPLLGNLFPQHFSFLASMRYYAGNWAYSIWLFRDNGDEKMDGKIVKCSPCVRKQLLMFYDDETAEALISKVMGFRSMHLHGRILQLVLPKAVDDIDAYTWRDGELIAGVALGWNFGDGHLHDEQLLAAIQKRCQYGPGELRCIFVESQPMGKPHIEYRVVDAHDGLLEKNRVLVRDLKQLMPWPACD